MRTIGIVALVVLAGCAGNRHEAVDKASNYRDESVAMYVANDDVQDNFLIDKLEQAEYARIDEKANHEREMADAIYQFELKKLEENGKINASDVVRLNDSKSTAMKRVDELVKARKSEVANVVDLLRQARKKNKINLAIATKMNEMVRSYDDAEIDLSAGFQAIKDLQTILNQELKK